MFYITDVMQRQIIGDKFCELQRNKNEAVVAYFKILSNDLPGLTVKHHENSINLFGVPLETRSRLLQNTNLNLTCDPQTSAVQSIDVGVYKVTVRAIHNGIIRVILGSEFWGASSIQNFWRKCHILFNYKNKVILSRECCLRVSSSYADFL